MLVIYKYPVIPNDEICIEMPEDAQILTVDTQFGKPQIWALVNPQNPLEKRHFRMAGTGHSIDEKQNLHHLGTFQMDEGTLIFHLFEILNN
ncbi:MAG: hypothetical protein GY834_10655 [Bacteroidetes bacterium]|nr:hypothetical protein [Bacteroidota bacterium]